ncbi:MAG: autotransporter-associated beta strand repeat-containing protein [Chthoniobacter sp.]|nr:autotransporter-associated beta strand repeat-containing protein [Chthoniobacter sp.]
MKPAKNPFNRLASKRSLTILSASILALSAPDLTAATYTWTQTVGGTYAWATGADWLGGVAPIPVSGDTLDFSTVDIGGNITLTLDGDQTGTLWRFGDTAGAQSWTIDAGTPTGKLVLAGASATIGVLQNSATINAVVDGTDGLIKSGSGTLVLTGVNTYTGTTAINDGILTLNGQTGSLASTTPLTFGGTATFNMSNTGAAGALAQSLGALTFSAGEGTVKTTRVVSQDQALTFSSLAARTAGATGNFVSGGGVNSATNGFVLTGVPANSFIDKGIFYGGSDFAWHDAGGFVRAINYGSDTGAGTSGSRTTLASAAHQQITGAVVAQSGGTAFTTFKISGANNLTLADSGTVTTDSILKSGNNSATISGGTGLKTTTSGGELVIRTDLSGDALTISSPILANGTNVVTKSGAGTLTLSGVNTYTGGTFLNSGTLILGSTTALGATASTLTIGGGTFLGVSNAITNANNNAQNWNGDFTFAGTNTLNLGTGAVTLGAPSVQVSLAPNNAGHTLTVGGAIGDGGMGYGLTVAGTSTLILTGASTYTGATTITGGGAYQNSTQINASPTLQIGSGTTGSLNGVTGTPLIFNTSGTFNVKEAAASAQQMTSLTLNSGDATIKSTFAATTANLTFNAAPVRSVGSTATFVVSGGAIGTAATNASGTLGTNNIILTGQANQTPMGVAYFAGTGAAAGNNYAFYDGAGFVRPLDYVNDAIPAGAATYAGAQVSIASGSYAQLQSGGSVSAQANGTTFTGLNIVNTANSAQAFTLAAGATVTVNGILRSGNGGSSSTTTISGGTALQAANNAELVIRADQSNDLLTISAPIVANGTNAVTKSGAGTLTLSSSNSFTGGISISGPLFIGHANALGNGTVTFNAGSSIGDSVANVTITGVTRYVFNGNFNTINTAKNIDFGTAPVTINAPLTFGVTNSNTIGGPITGPGGLNAFDITGADNGGTGYGFTLSAPISLRAGQTVRGKGALINGVISDGGNGYGVTLNGSYTGTWTFTAANTYTGATIINSGATLNIGNNGGTGSLNPNSAIADYGTLTFNRTGTITQGTDFGTISGSGSVTKSASGTAILTSANTYTGVTAISTGTLQIGSGGTAGSLNASSTIINNATLSFNRSDDIVQGTAFSGLAISGTGALTKLGTGTVTLNASNTFTGTTTISNGKIALGNALALQNSAYVTTGSTGAIGLDVTGYATPTLGGLSGAVNLATAITGYGSVTALTLNPQSGSQTYSGIIADGTAGMTLTKSGAGTQILSGANSYSGTTTISAGTLQIGAGGATGSLNASSAIVNNGTLTFNRTGTITQGTDFAGVISGLGAVTQAGSGTTIFTGANTYKGLTTISTGTLQIGAGGTVGELDTTSLIVNNGTLAFNRSDNIAQGTAFSGLAISGTGGLTKLSTGTLTLNAANTFTGNTLISNGRVALGHALALQTSAYDTTGSTGAIGLDVTGFVTPTLGGLSGSVALATAITGYGSVTGLTLNPQSGKSVTYSGIIGDGAGNMTLTKSGAGTQTLTGLSTYAGTTTVTGGTLIADTATNATILNAASALVFSGNGGTLQYKGLAAQTRTQILNGLTLTGGVATIDANNTGTSTTIDLRGSGGLLAITRSSGGGTVDFKATTGTLGTTAVVKTAQANDANGILGAWATVGGGANWAINNGSNVVAAYASYTDIALAGTISDATTTNVRINSGASGNITLGAATTNINTLMQNLGTAATVDTATKVLRLGTGGGILVATGKQALTIGTVAGSGTLTAGGNAVDVAGELILNNSSSNGLTINSAIANNGTGAVALTKSGTGTVTLATTNSYSGGTSLNAGTLTLGNGAAIGGGTLTINGGTISGNFTLTNNNPIVANGDFSLGGGLNTGAVGTFKIAKPLTITGGGTIGNVITDLSGTNTLNALDISWAVPSTTTNMTVGGNITLRSNQTLNVNVAHVTDSLFFNGNFGDGGLGYGLTVSGVLNSGNLIFAGSHTYTGTTTINPGITLTLGNAGAVGSLSPSSAIVDNGVLRFNRNNTMTQGTDFGGISGIGGVTVGGGGTTVLNALNTYTGVTTIRSIGNSTLSVTKLADGGLPSSIGQSSSAAANLVLGDNSTNDGFMLKYIGSGDSTDRLFTLGADWGLNTHKIDASGSGPLLFTNPGSLAFSGAANQARSLTLTGTNTGGNTLTARIENNGTGALSLIKSGAGTWILAGNSAYTGVTTISGGILSVATLANGGVASPIGQASNLRSNLVLSGGTLSYTGATTSVDRAFTVSANSTIDVSTAATNLTLGDASLGAITLGVTGGSGSSLSLGGIAITGAATLNPTTANLSVASVGSVGGNFALTLSGTSTGNIATDVIGTGTGALTKSGTGSWTLSGGNTYTGITTISAGTLVAGTNAPSAAIGAFGNAVSEVVLGVAGGNSNAGILIGGAFDVGRIIRIPTNNTTDTGTRILTLGGNTAASSIFSGNIFLGTTSQAGRGVTLTAASGGQVTFSGVIQNPSGMDATTYTVTKAGAGTVVFSNANTYTGLTTVGEGTLRLGITDGIKPGNPVTVVPTGSGAVLDLAGFDQSIGGAGLTLGGSTATSAATVINSTGTSTLTLSGGTTAATYVAANVPNDPLGATISVASLTLANAAQTFTVGDSANVTGSANELTVTSAITAAGASSALVKAGDGALRLDGAQGYDILTANAGTTNVNGVLGSAPGLAVVTVAAGTTKLKFGSVSQTLSSLTIGAGATVTFTSGPASGSLTGGGGGKAPGFGGSAVVPEPGTIGLLLVGALGVLNQRRRPATKIFQG